VGAGVDCEYIWSSAPSSADAKAPFVVFACAREVVLSSGPTPTRLHAHSRRTSVCGATGMCKYQRKMGSRSPNGASSGASRSTVMFGPRSVNRTTSIVSPSRRDCAAPHLLFASYTFPWRQLSTKQVKRQQRMRGLCYFHFAGRIIGPLLSA
jgi:hypothetical protein